MSYPRFGNALGAALIFGTGLLLGALCALGYFVDEWGAGQAALAGTTIFLLFLVMALVFEWPSEVA